MINYEAIRAITREDNEANPDSFGFGDLDVEDEAAIEFAKTAVRAYVPRLMLGQMGVEDALVYSSLAGMRMGLLIGAAQHADVPDLVPEEWAE